MRFTVTGNALPGTLMEAYGLLEKALHSFEVLKYLEFKILGRMISKCILKTKLYGTTSPKFRMPFL